MFTGTVGYRGRTARCAAFTLVEILAVVVILGIASAIIIPEIGSRDDMRVQAAARTAIADLIYAQNLAISTGTPVYVRVDKTNNKYSLLTNPLSSKTKFGDPISHPITQSDYVTQFNSSTNGWQGVTINAVTMTGIDAGYSNQFTVGFDEIGSPYVWSYSTDTRDDLSTGSITLKAGTFTKVISISASTGEITVN